MWFKTIQQDLKSNDLSRNKTLIWLGIVHSAQIDVCVWSYLITVVNAGKEVYLQEVYVLRLGFGNHGKVTYYHKMVLYVERSRYVCVCVVVGSWLRVGVQHDDLLPERGHG